jgi:hypothetical protein
MYFNVVTVSMDGKKRDSWNLAIDLVDALDEEINRCLVANTKLSYITIEEDKEV